MYLHTITQHQVYIEKLLLWIKIKQKDLKTRIDQAPACVNFVRKKGCKISRQEKVNLSTELDITWQTAPSKMRSIAKPHKCCIATSTNVFLTKVYFAEAT